jgi:hypothetical protein
MKLFSLAVLMVLGSFNLGFANGNSNATKASATANLANFVKENVEYPDFLKEDGINKACMLLEFSVDESGDIDILNTNQSDPRIKDYVLMQLQDVNLKASDYVAGQNYLLKLNFKLL